MVCFTQQTFKNKAFTGYAVPKMCHFEVFILVLVCMPASAELGVARVKDEACKAILVHCYGHCFNLSQKKTRQQGTFWNLAELPYFNLEFKASENHNLTIKNLDGHVVMSRTASKLTCCHSTC